MLSKLCEHIVDEGRSINGLKMAGLPAAHFWELATEGLKHWINPDSKPESLICTLESIEELARTFVERHQRNAGSPLHGTFSEEMIPEPCPGVPHAPAHLPEARDQEYTLSVLERSGGGGGAALMDAAPPMHLRATSPMSTVQAATGPPPETTMGW